jgi:hypothetical protein
MPEILRKLEKSAAAEQTTSSRGAAARPRAPVAEKADVPGTKVPQPPKVEPASPKGSGANRIDDGF